MGNSLTRRSFVKWGSATAGAAALVGFTGCAPAGDAGTDTGPAASAGEKGEWKTGACMNNCSSGSSRCLLKVYVEDGVPLKVRTDEQDEDTIEVPQRRACPRGRAQISNITSPARIKHPMKRKGWSPENPNGEMRGKDEWERISWDEALDYIAAEMKKAYDAYGTGLSSLRPTTTSTTRASIRLSVCSTAWAVLCTTIWAPFRSVRGRFPSCS